MTKKIKFFGIDLPTSAEKPLTYEERYNGVCKNLEKRNDEIIKLRDYIISLEDKLLQIKSDYNLDDNVIDIEDLINDNLK